MDPSAAFDSCDATGRHSLKFFVELQDARSALLNFKARGRYKWQVVHDWLLDARRPSHHTGSGQYQHSIVVTTLPQRAFVPFIRGRRAMPVGARRSNVMSRREVQAETNLLSAFALMLGGTLAAGLPMALLIIWVCS
jgi:hypothetical protein